MEEAKLRRLRDERVGEMENGLRGVTKVREVEKEGLVEIGGRKSEEEAMAILVVEMGRQMREEEEVGIFIFRRYSLPFTARTTCNFRRWMRLTE